MINKDQIEQLVNRAEVEFVICWELLASMKKGKLQVNPHVSLTDFQPRLATTISDLSRLYRGIEQEKISRIRHKNKYTEKWFKSRMNFLSKQQEVLNRTISVGKGIGDAFAWFFYQRDRHYLAEHLALQTQHHSPPGIGGAGELEFIRNIQHMHGYFILYHGNTNILRLGDLTFIDLKTFRVAGIGELKSRSSEPGKLNITLLLSGPNIKFDKSLVNSIQTAQTKNTASVEAKLSASGQDRLNRQIQRISSSFEKLVRIPDTKLGVQIDSQLDAFAEFVTGINSGEFSYRKFSKGLLLVGYKETKRTLYNKLSNSKQSNLATKLSGIETHALNLISKDRDDNTIIIDGFYYDEKGKTRHIPGMTHFVWWPLIHEATKSILFQDVMVLTIFNPAHFFASLESAGFSVKKTGKLGYKICKKRDAHEFVIDGLNYYLTMIQQYLFTEDEIASFLREAEELVESPNSGSPQRIELHIEQQFGRKPTQ